MRDKKITLIITGGIAAYKSLDLIRRLRERGASVRVVMTRAACEFITPMAAGAVSGQEAFTDLWDRATEQDIGHIRLARESDLIIVAPASADFIARMANGMASDLAGAILLARSCPVLIAPSMNPFMWSNASTRRNHARLLEDGIRSIGPERGEMAERDEAGLGRMSEPEAIAEAASKLLESAEGILSGRKAIVTSGGTLESIDPVRYVANRSSGRQGHAIAEALRDAGAQVILISGPVSIPTPWGVELVSVETAREMHEAVESALPADIAVMAAAVSDWRVKSESSRKLKKGDSKGSVILEMIENPDILRMVSSHDSRPSLVIGFAAETERVEEHGRSKRESKGADWILANDVSPGTGVMGGSRNRVCLIDEDGSDQWPLLSKREVADRLVERIASRLGGE